MDTPYQISQRVDNYLKYRPHYPLDLIELLRDRCKLSHQHVVADIGCGTGILSWLFLQNGNPVYGIEPDPDMRAGAEKYLQGYPNFTCLNAVAEATTISAKSVDFVTAGQAFHWFNVEQTRLEFQRIIAPGGWVVLVWNIQKSTGTPFLDDLQRFWANELFRQEFSEQESIKMARAQKRRLNPDLAQRELVEPFFRGGKFSQVFYNNPLDCDFEALKGRILSNRSTLGRDHPLYAAMVAKIRGIFQDHQVDGTVTIDHDTWVVYGQLPKHNG